MYKSGTIVPKCQPCLSINMSRTFYVQIAAKFVKFIRLSITLKLKELTKNLSPKLYFKYS